jgi:hypothetical protein
MGREIWNLKSVFYDWNKKCRGMGLPVGNKSTQHLLFADNQAIAAEDKDDAEYMAKK